MTACDLVIHIDVSEETASFSFGMVQMVQMRLLFV